MLIICTSAMLVLLLPALVLHFQSSVLRAYSAPFSQLLAALPWPSCNAALALLAFVVFESVLLVCLPGKTVYGPITPMGERPQYRDNAMKAWAVTHIAWLVLGPLTGIIPFAKAYDMWGSIIATCNAIMIPFCIFLYFKGRYFPSCRDTVWTGNYVFDFFQGVELHPQLFGVQLKQLINCRVSMMAWSLSQLWFAQAQYERIGYVSSGMIVCTALHVIFLAKFFLWEPGYFHALDIIYDRSGYYIFWGILCWVPAFYCLAAFVLVENPVDWSVGAAAAIFVVGIVALALNYEADRQKQHIRATDGKGTIWGRPCSIIRAKYASPDGVERSNILLVSGLWSVSRHFNYAAEWLVAFCWCLAATSSSLLTMSYFIFLVMLFLDRVGRDEEKCRKKYGSYWVTYCQRVPYRLVPYVF